MTLTGALRPHALSHGISQAQFFAPGALGLNFDQVRQPASPFLPGWEKEVAEKELSGIGGKLGECGVIEAKAVVSKKEEGVSYGEYCQDIE